MFQPNNPYGQNQGNSPYNQYRRPRRRGGCLAWLVLLVFLGAGGWLAYQYLQTNPWSVSFLGEFFISKIATEI